MRFRGRGSRLGGWVSKKTTREDQALAIVDRNWIFDFYLWHNADVPVWLERFVLTVLAGAFTAAVLVNAMKFDIAQRVSLGIAIAAIAYFVAHTVHIQKAAPTPVVQPPASPVVTPTPQTSHEAPSPESRASSRKNHGGHVHPKHSASPAATPSPSFPVSHLQYTQEEAASLEADAPYAVKVVIQTNVTLQPTSLVIQCDVEAKASKYHVVGSGTMRDSGNGYVGEKSNFWVYFGDQPLKPETPFNLWPRNRSTYLMSGRGLLLDIKGASC
jgi:hypothetical protein